MIDPKDTHTLGNLFDEDQEMLTIKQTLIFSAAIAIVSHQPVSTSIAVNTAKKIYEEVKEIK